MKFLVLAYGAEKDWLALSHAERDRLLAQDEVLRRRGDVVAAVEPAVTTVRNADRHLTTSAAPFASSGAPLAGFGIIEAVDLEEAIQLVVNTPCAVARGAVELRPIMEINL